MNFKEFYHRSTFKLLHEGRSNWNYYLMQYENNSGVVVALAKPGTGSSDCHFGNIEYFNRMLKRGVI